MSIFITYWYIHILTIKDNWVICKKWVLFFYVMTSSDHPCILELQCCHSHRSNCELILKKNYVLGINFKSSCPASCFWAVYVLWEVLYFRGILMSNTLSHTTWHTHGVYLTLFPIAVLWHRGSSAASSSSGRSEFLWYWICGDVTGGIIKLLTRLFPGAMAWRRRTLT